VGKELQLALKRIDPVFERMPDDLLIGLPEAVDSFTERTKVGVYRIFRDSVLFSAREE
jgi:hypothetical protein